MHLPYLIADCCYMHLAPRYQNNFWRDRGEISGVERYPWFHVEIDGLYSRATLTDVSSLFPVASSGYWFHSASNILEFLSTKEVISFAKKFFSRVCLKILIFILLDLLFCKLQHIFPILKYAFAFVYFSVVVKASKVRYYFYIIDCFCYILKLYLFAYFLTTKTVALFCMGNFRLFFSFIFQICRYHINCTF